MVFEFSYNELVFLSDAFQVIWENFTLFWSQHSKWPVIKLCSGSWNIKLSRLRCCRCYLPSLQTNL